MKSIINYPEGELILQCAFSYALGRKTYVVSTIVDTITNEWGNLEPFMKKYFKTLIKEAMKTGSAGMEMDVQQWQKILDLEEL